MARRQHLALSLLLAVFFFLSLSYFFTSAPGHATLTGSKQRPLAPSPPDPDKTSEFSVDLGALPTPSLDGDSVAPKLENATLKAELGRATWRFLHTMVARFPDKPTANERAMLESFVRMFSFLYPCGDCARHFRAVLAEYPPQTSSRSAAAGWMCFVHNVVNKRLGKRAFDCEKIGDFYDCGCAEDKKGGDGKKGGGEKKGDGDGKKGGGDEKKKGADGDAKKKDGEGKDGKEKSDKATDSVTSKVNVDSDKSEKIIDKVKNENAIDDGKGAKASVAGKDEKVKD